MVGTYEITRNSRRVDARLFKSNGAILDFIKTQPAGDYEVHRVLPRDPDGVPNSEYWGKVAIHENGEVSAKWAPSFCTGE